MYCSNWCHSTFELKSNFCVDIAEYCQIKEQENHTGFSELSHIGEKLISFFYNEAEIAVQRIGMQFTELFALVKWLEK